MKQFQQLTLRIVDLVNSPRKTQRIIRETTVPRMVLQDIIDSIRILDSKGFLVCSLSEISLRSGGGKMLITPAGIPFGRISEEGLYSVNINNTSRSEEGLNTPHYLDWHREIYKRSTANVVLLCQPTYASIMANRMQQPDTDIISISKNILGSVKNIDGLAFHDDQPIDNSSTVLIKSVGILAWGDNMNEVTSRMEVLEKLCEISVIDQAI